MKLLILLSIISGYFVVPSTSQVTCTTCGWGMVGLDGGSTVLKRFADDEASANVTWDNMISFGLASVTADEACNTFNACGNKSTCTSRTTIFFLCECDQNFSPNRTNVNFNCAVTKCGKPPNFQNGKFGDGCSSDSAVNTTCIITCNDGYHRNGDNTATCIDSDLASNSNATGRWDYDTTCTPITCETSPNVPNGFIADGCGSGSEYNDTCQITCYEGYYISGEEKITCVDEPGPDDTNQEGEWNYGDTNCTDIDECASSPCDTNANCTNSKGSFTCTCNTGYSGDGFACQDIDECGSSPCDTNANCTSSKGSFTCTCNTGYSGDGFTCEQTSTQDIALPIMGAVLAFVLIVLLALLVFVLVRKRRSSKHDLSHVNMHAIGVQPPAH